MDLSDNNSLIAQSKNASKTVFNKSTEVSEINRVGTRRRNNQCMQPMQNKNKMVGQA